MWLKMLLCLEKFSHLIYHELFGCKAVSPPTLYSVHTYVHTFLMTLTPQPVSSSRDSRRAPLGQGARGDREGKRAFPDRHWGGIHRCDQTFARAADPHGADHGASGFGADGLS